MKKLNWKLSVLVLLMFMFCVRPSRAQNIDVNAGDGYYDPGNFTGYGGNGPEVQGTFYASAGKTPGVIPAYTVQLIITLAEEVPWTGAAFTIPPGWELDPASTPTNLIFYNSTDWTTGDPHFEIPVKAIAPRSSTAQSVGTQIFNNGGDWVDGDNSNLTTSAVTVTNKPLPVTLVSFIVIREGKTALLNWATAQETNSDHFEIQRSLNGKNWTPIGTVPSHSESSDLKNYSFADTRPARGENLYRLKMIDRDASFAYSSIRSVSFSDGESIAYVYPNPSSDRVFLNTTKISAVKEAVVLDMNGRAVSGTSAIANGVDVRKLAAGVYMLKVSGADGSSSIHKFVISR